MAKKITLLGSTGSIGTQSLDVIRAQGYEVFGLSAHSQTDKLLQQIEEFHPKYVCMTSEAGAEKLSAALAGRADAPKLLTGPEGLKTLAAMDGPDVVLNSVVGIAGLGASLAAIESGHDLALANKESLVTGGHLVTQAVAKHGVKLLPVDSEHSAIFQCLQDKESAKSLTKILLTASGGPFFGMKTEELRGKTKADALKHPNWNMGAKITIDSATLMNKGLELIEAVWLFGLPPEKIQIVVQRQSIVHSAVQYSDNSIIAQLGVPDMRIPIQYALTYPARVPGVVPELDFTTLKLLTFDVADEETFRCLAACKKAIKKGISFYKVGCDFIRQYKKNPNITNVRVIFITKNVDFKTLHDTAKKIDDVTKTMNTILEGMPEDLDCASCSFKPVCDEVEGLKELHFGKAGKKAPKA